jgi:hypothetical protein
MTELEYGLGWSCWCSSSTFRQSPAEKCIGNWVIFRHIRNAVSNTGRLKFNLSWLCDDHISNELLRRERPSIFVKQPYITRFVDVLRVWQISANRPAIRGWGGYQVASASAPCFLYLNQEFFTISCMETVLASPLMFDNLILLWVGFANLGHRCLHYLCHLTSNRNCENVFESLLTNKPELNRLSLHKRKIESTLRNLHQRPRLTQLVFFSNDFRRSELG